MGEREGEREGGDDKGLGTGREGKKKEKRWKTSAARIYSTQKKILSFKNHLMLNR